MKEEVMKKVIEKAISVGWDDKDYAFGGDCSDECWEFCAWKYDRKILLDPNFWKCLGKAEGWEYEIDYEDGENVYYKSNKGDWQFYWHNFIDHLAENKPLEDYFKNLIK